MAGLGDTSHVFDYFAQSLTPPYRVLGVTQRAHGRSSAPTTGYGFVRLAEDVVRVIDTMGVNKPVVIGHSLMFLARPLREVGDARRVDGDPGSCPAAGVVDDIIDPAVHSQVDSH